MAITDQEMVLIDPLATTVVESEQGKRSRAQWSLCVKRIDATRVQKHCLYACPKEEYRF